MRYRLGLDIGIASVGWSIIGVNEAGEPKQIINLGVRTFEPLEHPKDGSSLMLPRREARGTRRRLRRRANRLLRIKALLDNTFGKGFCSKISQDKFIDVYNIRKQALDRLISQEELSVILLSLAKRRGFKSNRKSEESDKDTGKLLKIMKDNQEYRISKGYRTVGEMLACDERFVRDAINNRGERYKIYNVRNKDGNYFNCIYRKELEEEIAYIFKCQQEFNNSFASEDLKETYLNIFNSQRAFDEGPGEPSPYKKEFAVGYCTFLPEEKRAPKASYTFEYSIIMQKINNLKISGANSRELTIEEKNLLREYALSAKELKYSQIRKKLDLADNEMFNLLSYSRKKTIEEVEKATFVTMKNSYDIKKTLNDGNKNDIILLDEIAILLSMNKSDERILREIKSNSIFQRLSSIEVDNLLKLSFSKFGYLSIKALKIIEPYLEQGYRYNEACEKAGIDFKAHSSQGKYKLLNCDEIYDLIKEINAPVVKRSISQTLKVINAIIRQYGSPIAVNIEIARELSKIRSERDKIKKDNELRAADNERFKNRIIEEYGISSVSGQDIVKFRLYEEQGGKCAYSGKVIVPNLIFDPTYLQVDHIIPYSRSFNDSYNNKVLVLSVENQHKKNMIPYEWFGQDKDKWSRFESFVESTYQYNTRKRDIMLRKSFTIEDEKEWKERALNDTKYISRFVYNLINDYLELDDSIDIGKRRVKAVNGAITSYLRKMWGITKIREDGDLHHALDATVIACVTDSIVHNITQYNKTKEIFLRNNRGLFDPDTGIRIDRMTYDVLNLDDFSKIKNLLMPYETFKSELIIRLSSNLEDYLNRLLEIGYDLETASKIKPVFVSRMPNRKCKGQLHKDTIRSAKILNENKVITKTAITDLKLNKENEIDGYYRQEDDKLLYNALRERLLNNNGNAKEAFKDGFYKPKSDGTQGNPVKKVKIVKPVTLGIKLDKVKAFADNGSMVRIDLFTKGDKYYSVPVYVSDIYKGVIPNKAIEAGKSYQEWSEMDGTYEFLYSLYPNDLVYIEHKANFVLTHCNYKDKKKEVKSEMLYYKGIDISTGAALFKTHNQEYEVRIGLKTLKSIEKYVVDTLGNIYKINREKRQLNSTKASKKE